MGSEVSRLRRIAGLAARLPLKLVPAGTVVPVLSGQLRGARWVVGTGTHGCWVGSYERLTREWVCRLLTPGKVAYDVGANAGFFTLLASRLVGVTGRVIAFEPAPANLLALRRHVELNAAINVEVIDAAVAEAPGSAVFEAAGSAAQGHLSDAGSLEVQVVQMDDLVGRAVIPTPDFLKIDVEGAELRVLEGARRVLSSGHPSIVLSAHGARLFGACKGFLLELGYRVVLVKDGTPDGDYLLVADGGKAGA
jgi:FkbM family methyltransferase